MNHKITLYVIIAFLLGTIIMFSLQQLRINRLEQKNKADMYSEQQLFDIDQKTINLDVRAYNALEHCYDKPTSCDIFNPGNKADQFASESIRLTKEKQNIISKNPLLIPEQYRAAWGVK